MKYLETHLLEWEKLLRDRRIVINVWKSDTVRFTCRHIPQLRPFTFIGDEIRCEQKVTLDRRLTWSSHIDQVRRKAFQRLGVNGPLLNKLSGLSIRNGLMQYRQLIRPMMDYACPVSRHAADHLAKATLALGAISQFQNL